VLRKYNEAADALAKMASERAPIPLDVFVSDLYKPSIDYKDDGRSDEPPSEPSSDPKDSAAKNRRPWTSSQSHLRLTTRLIGATLCFNA